MSKREGGNRGEIKTTHYRDRATSNSFAKSRCMAPVWKRAQQKLDTLRGPLAAFRPSATLPVARTLQLPFPSAFPLPLSHPFPVPVRLPPAPTSGTRQWQKSRKCHL